MIRAHMATSLDGFVAGANQTLEKPFGDHTEHFNDWLWELAAVRKTFGKTGGDTGPSNDVFLERTANIGAFVMGRNMFGGGPGPWAKEPRWDGWWGENPPYHAPVFVPHPLPAGPAADAGRHDLPLRDRRHRVRARKSPRGRQGQGRRRRGRRQAVGQALRAGALDMLELHLIPRSSGRERDCSTGSSPESSSRTGSSRPRA
jgi:dihydrofolate reductase